MFRYIRAAAAAVFALGSLTVAAAPAAANGGIFDHASANTGVSPLGLNSDTPVRATASARSSGTASVTAFQHMVGLANVAAPRTPTLDLDVARLAAVET